MMDALFVMNGYYMRISMNGYTAKQILSNG